MADAKTHSRAELVSFLSASLGEAACDALVSDTSRALGLEPDRFTIEQALKVLERLATRPGLVGITARFSMARLILAWGHGKAP